uniref:DDE Tnp4 domain-containing protein n=1 Tax=Esox lucius TaxID=8010 RepID=A0AAY5KP50_ESOLU
MYDLCNCIQWFLYEILSFAFLMYQILMSCNKMQINYLKIIECDFMDFCFRFRHSQLKSTYDKNYRLLHAFVSGKTCKIVSISKRQGFSIPKLAVIDQFLLFLCRLRQGFPEQDLAVRFDVSQSTVSRVCVTWANYLHFMLGSLPIWPSRETVNELMPPCFQSTFPLTRVILDCTEIHVQRPSSKVLNSEIYSHYKGDTTFKGLVGISPSGLVTFVSDLYTGSISDKEITRESGILSLLEEGDEVMADKGFLIKDLLDEINVSLVTPPFLGPSGHFSQEEVRKTQAIARLRFHVECAIRRIKQVEVDPLQVIVLFAPNKEIAPCHTGDTHLSHYLVVVLMDFLQSIGSISLAV